MQDKFRYRLDYDEKTISFRLVLVNTLYAIEMSKTIEQKGWKTICKYGERDFLKKFVQLVKMKYYGYLKLKTSRVIGEMKAYQKTKGRAISEGFTKPQNTQS